MSYCIFIVLYADQAVHLEKNVWMVFVQNILQVLFFPSSGIF